MLFVRYLVVCYDSLKSDFHFVVALIKVEKQALRMRILICLLVEHSFCGDGVL